MVARGMVAMDMVARGLVARGIVVSQLRLGHTIFVSFVIWHNFDSAVSYSCKDVEGDGGWESIVARRRRYCSRR